MNKSELLIKYKQMLTPKKVAHELCGNDQNKKSPPQ